MFGRDFYYISFLGKPSEKEPWMLQFGGHHLALNVTIAGEQGVLTPSLTGAQPALYTVNGKTVRPLGQESDKALALLNSLDAQRKQAILNYRVADLVLGPGQDGKTIQPEGLKASAMSERRAMLLDLIAEWSGIVHESAAAARMAEIKDGLADTWFAWSGPTTVAPGRTSPPTTGSRARISSSSTRRSRWAAIRRCTFTPCTATRRTTTVGSTQMRPPLAASARSCCRDPCVRPSAGRVPAGDDHRGGEGTRPGGDATNAGRRRVPHLLAAIDTDGTASSRPRSSRPTRTACS